MCGRFVEASVSERRRYEARGTLAFANADSERKNFSARGVRLSFFESRERADSRARLTDRGAPDARRNFSAIAARRAAHGRDASNAHSIGITYTSISRAFAKSASDACSGEACGSMLAAPPVKKDRNRREARSESAVREFRFACTGRSTKRDAGRCERSAGVFTRKASASRLRQLRIACGKFCAVIRTDYSPGACGRGCPGMARWAARLFFYI